MSTLKVDNIRDNGSGFNDVVSFQNVNGTENGRLCRAFVNFNGVGAVAIRGSFNVNSITDNGGAGDYTVNFANAMSDANYAASFSAHRGDGGGANYGLIMIQSTADNSQSFSSSAIRLRTMSSTGVSIDYPLLCVIICR